MMTMDYRLYKLDDSGHIVGVTQLHCQDNESAIDEAASKITAGAYELWCGAEMIQIFEDAST